MKKLLLLALVAALPAFAQYNTNRPGQIGGSGSVNTNPPGTITPPGSVSTANTRPVLTDPSGYVISPTNFTVRDQTLANNITLTNVQARRRAGKNLRIANYGDDAYSPQVGNVGSTLLGRFMLWSGTIGSSGGTYYSDFTAGVTQTTFGSGTIPFIVYGMPTASGLTNRTAFPTDTVTLQYVRSNGFGLITVLTNDGGAGAWGVVGVVNANNGGEREGAKTNFTVAAGTRKAAAWSTGTNVIQYVGNYHSTTATNFIWDIFEAGNIDLLTATTNTFWLGCATKWLSQYDVVIFNESSQSNQCILGYPGFYAAMRSNAPNTDCIFLQPPPTTNSPGTTLAYRLAYGKLARDYGLPVFDAAGLLVPLDTAQLKPLYTADGVHLSTAGNTFLTRELVGLLLNPFTAQRSLPILPYADSVPFPGDVSVGGRLLATNRVTLVNWGEWIAGGAVVRNETGDANTPPWIASAGCFYNNSGTGGGYFAIPIPPWITNATVTLWCQNAATYPGARWTNTVRLDWDTTADTFRPTTSGASVEFPIISSNSVASTLTFPITNAASAGALRKNITITVGACTNTSTRYFFGPAIIIEN